jgi:hypothetical protein
VASGQKHSSRDETATHRAAAKLISAGISRGPSRLVPTALRLQVPPSTLFGPLAFVPRRPVFSSILLYMKQRSHSLKSSFRCTRLTAAKMRLLGKPASPPLNQRELTSALHGQP